MNARMLKAVPMLALLLVAASCAGSAGSAGDTTKAPPAAGPANNPAVRAAIDSADQKFTAVFKAGDAAGAAAFYEDDATSMAPNTEAATGRAAIEKAYADTFKQLGKVNDFSATAKDVDIYPDHVVEVGTYEFSFTPTGAKEPMKDHGGYINFWRKQADGSWKIHREAIVSASPLPGMTPPAGAAKKK
jgi:uncharacterized protein (TIGR02246 family)